MFRQKSSGGRLQCVHYSERSEGDLKQVRDVFLSQLWIISSFFLVCPVMDPNPRSHHLLMSGFRAPWRFIFLGSDVNEGVVITSGPSPSAALQLVDGHFSFMFELPLTVSSDCIPAICLFWLFCFLKV